MKNFSCWAPKWNEEAALISFKIENASTRKMARVVVLKKSLVRIQQQHDSSREMKNVCESENFSFVMKTEAKTEM